MGCGSATHGDLPMTIQSRRSADEPLPGLAGTEGLDEACALMVKLAVGSRLDRLGAITQEHLATGGKRMRALLALAAAEALGVQRRAAAPWAAACELLHQASLIHDDLQDGDRVRRGVPAVWANHGLSAAINAGDLLLMLPWQAIDRLDASEEVRYRLVRATASRAEQTVRGQARDGELLAAERLGNSDWEHAARGKSGAILALPVEGAALLAGLGESSARKLAEPFAMLGVLYQAIDDLTDLYGDKGRNMPGNDLREGKVSSIVVEHIHRCPDDREALLTTLRTERTETSDEEVSHWIERFRTSGTLESCRLRIIAMHRAISADPTLVSVPDLARIADDLSSRLVAKSTEGR